jgi:O-antigen/teichoic acid export membrane protein
MVRAVSPEIFGQMAVLTALSGVLVVVFGLGFETPVLRETVLGRADGSSVRGAATYLLVLVPVAGCLLAVGAVASGIQLASLPAWGLGAAIISAGFAAASTALLLPIIRGQELMSRYVAVMVIAITVQVGLTAWLVLMRHEGLRGWAIAAVGAAIAQFVIALACVRPSLGPIWPEVKPALELGLPTLPHQLAMWGLNFVDRLIIFILIGAHATGLYSIAYQMASVLGIVCLELNRALMPRYVRAADNPDEALRLARMQFAIFISFLGCALVVMPLTRPVIFNGEYAGAYPFLALLLLSQLCYSLYLIPANLVTLTAGISKRMWMASGAAVVTNVALNFAADPYFGAWGAVGANVMAFAVLVGVAVVIELHAMGVLKKGALAPAAVLIIALGGLSAACVLSSLGADWTASIAAFLAVAAVVGSGRGALR